MNFCSTWRHSLAITGILLLSACANLDQTVTHQQLIEFKQNQTIEQWQITGKIGVRNTQKATSASLNWQQCQQHFDIRLSGPLGLGAIHTYGDEHQSTLETQQQTLHADSPEKLLEQTGWPIPVQELNYWLRGLPQPHKPYTEEISDSSYGFHQSGWLVLYSRSLKLQDGDHIDSHKRYTLPSKAIAQKDDIKVTLLLNSWDLNPDCEPNRD